MNLIDRLSKLDGPDATVAATKQKIRDAFKGVRTSIAILRAKVTSHGE